MVINNTGLDQKKLLQRTKAIIITFGELGSRVCTSDYEIDIPAIKPKEVVDPTGAGDAYRAGLIKGLVKNLNIKQSAEMGSVCASFAIECYGTQEYYFSLMDFEKRLLTYPRITNQL